ncbi:hypothetical protein Hanom_Chr07g00599091 [Helianthus anomalus]
MMMMMMVSGRRCSGPFLSSGPRVTLVQVTGSRLGSCFKGSVDFSLNGSKEVKAGQQKTRLGSDSFRVRVRLRVNTVNPSKLGQHGQPESTQLTR